jgi:hypothetical protein
MPLDDASKSVLEQITELFNAQIHQYGINYKHHVGVVAGKKKDNSGADDEGKNDENNVE